MSIQLFTQAYFAVNLFPIGFGINGLFRPNAHLRALGFPVPNKMTENQSYKLSNALMRIWSVRNLSISFLGILVWSTGDARLMAKALVPAIAIATMDGFVSRLLIGGGETQHWVFPPVLMLLMAGLFGWFE